MAADSVGGSSSLLKGDLVWRGSPLNYDKVVGDKSKLVKIFGSSVDPSSSRINSIVTNPNTVDVGVAELTTCLSCTSCRYRSFARRASSIRAIITLAGVIYTPNLANSVALELPCSLLVACTMGSAAELPAAFFFFLYMSMNSPT